MRLSLGLSYGFCLQTWLVRLSMAELVCQKKSECSCYLQGHGMIDLHSTATSFNKTVANVSFHWQPCKVFTDSQSQGVCKDVNLCKYDKQNQTYTNLGSQSQFLYTAGHVIMRYSEGGRESEISLTCDKSTSLDIRGYNVSYVAMVLLSPCACPGHCVSGLSPGSILCIIFFSLLASYLVVGGLYRKTVHQSEGWDLIPNRHFWQELPGLIRDGYLFFISPCLGNRLQYTMYQHVPGHDYRDGYHDNEDSYHDNLRNHTNSNPAEYQR